MRNTQTLPTLPFGQPAPQVDAGCHHGLVALGRCHSYRSTIIPVPAASNIPGIPLAPRLAAMLLEPDSEDSLSTWNYFEARSATVYRSGGC